MANKAYHFLYGIHSGIPLCCIEFFVNVWDPRDLFHQDRPLVRAVHSSGVPYVQCPSCLRHKRVAKLRQCDTECWGDCASDFKAITSEDKIPC